MSDQDLSRRVVLRTLILGAAGATLAACGAKPEPAAAPAPAAPAPAPEAPPPPPADAAAPAPAPAPTAGGALPSLDPADPQAVALGYHADASKVDPKDAPTHVAGQACANCVQYQGAAGSTQGPCAIFVGKAVAATGWCKVYAKKPV